MNLRSAKYSIMSIALLAALCGAAWTASAGPLAVFGSYTGNINGTALAATSAGTINTDGPGGALIVTFNSIPNSTFTPLAVGSSVVTLICWSSAERLDANALNLFDLSGGNYTVDRTFTYPTLPGSMLTAMGTVATVGSEMTYTADFSGTYGGPTDIVGVSDYTVSWVQGPGNTVLETGAATLLLSGGGTLALGVSTTYGGLTSPLLLSQIGVYSPTPSYVETGPTTGVFTTNWTASVRSVPEPSTLALSCVGALGLLGIRRLRRRAAND